MLKASEARKRSVGADNKSTVTALADIEAKIEKAADAGGTTVDVAYISNPHVRNALEDNGYTVTHNDDPWEDERWTTISW